MLFKLSNLNSNLAVTLGYFNPALNNSVQKYFRCSQLSEIPFTRVRTNFLPVQPVYTEPCKVRGSRVNERWIRVSF